MSDPFSPTVTLGKTNLEVSRLGIASGYGVPAPAIEQAFHERGINFFYWSSPRKEGMGTALRNLAKAHRERMVIAIQSYDHGGWFLPTFFEKGLRALGIEYVDVLILGAYKSLPRPKVLKAVFELKQKNKVRFLAVSGHRRAFFRELLEKGDASPFDLFMIRYNAAHRGAEEEIFPHIPKDNAPGIMTYTATRWRKLLKSRKIPSTEQPLSATDCYRFVLSNPHVQLCMTGPANAQQLEQALLALKLGPLSEEEMIRARRIGDYVHG
jgi:aryl-alcohol dehydrogenase-like predicted oxidoreductase